MSVHVMSWVLRHSEATLGARLVLLVLADHAREDGSAAWPAVETIATEARLSRRAVQAALRRLEEDGAISSSGQSRTGTTVYCVAMGGAESAPVQQTHEGGEDSAPGGRSSYARTVHEPSIEPSGRSARGRAILSQAEEPETFSQWLGYHCIASGRSVPRAGTSARSELARTYAALEAEGYGLDDFQLASDGVLGDPFMRDNGHTKPENVLRKSKIAGRIDDGRRVRAAAAEKGDVADKWATFAAVNEQLQGRPAA